MGRILNAFIFISLFFISFDLFAVVGPGVKPAVGVPLDGGLLAVLAGAGIAYFAARKKKKNSQE